MRANVIRNAMQTARDLLTSTAFVIDNERRV